MTTNNDQGNEKWFNKFLDKVKTYQKRVGELEESVFDVRRKYDEVVARNLFLEREIETRTVELDRAQKSLLTLQHIWDTMRSAEPLGNVLSIVSSSLIENLDYNFCCVMQEYPSGDTSILKTRSFTDNEYIVKLDSVLEESLTSFSIPLNAKDNPLAKALNDKEIVVIKTFQDLLDGALPEISPERIKFLDVVLGEGSIFILPLKVEEQNFGVLYGVSQRPNVTNSEKSFLRMFADQIELAVTITKLFEQVREQAITDSLTKISNRRYFDQCLAQEAERALRLKQPFSLITLDMDHLKLINDTHGHSAGDAAIVHLATVLKDNARAIDLPARFGGEEFAVMLPGIDINGGVIAAERIRSAIEDKEVEGVGTVTASIGVSTFLTHTDNIGELLELADQAMYEAKQTGRNRVCVAKTTIRDVSWQEVALDTFINVLKEKHSPLTPELAKELKEKLQSVTRKDNSFVDTLYATVDCLISTVDTSRKEGYSENIVKYSVKLAKKAQLPQIEVDKIRLAALMHDLGKVGMPQQIISKPGPLDQEEWNIILQHPMIASQKFLGPVSTVENILPIIEHHHEHWDGSGYPSQLSGEEIPLGSRIILIADSYCAMTSDKTYRVALTKEEAIGVLKKGSNTKYDSKLLELFIDILEEEEN